MTLYGVFTNHSCMGVATHCLLLELLDVSVSELLVRGSTGTQSGRYVLVELRLCQYSAAHFISTSSPSLQNKLNQHVVESRH